MPLNLVWKSTIGLFTFFFFVLFYHYVSLSNIVDMSILCIVYGLMFVAFADKSKNSWVRWAALFIILYNISGDQGLRLNQLSVELASSIFLLIMASFMLLRVGILKKSIYILFAASLGIYLMFGTYFYNSHHAIISVGLSLLLPLFLIFSYGARIPNYLMNMSNCIACSFLCFYVFENRLQFEELYIAVDSFFPFAFGFVVLIGLFLNASASRAVKILLFNIFTVAFAGSVELSGLFFLILLQFLRIMKFSSFGQTAIEDSKKVFFEVINFNPMGSTCYMAGLFVIYFSDLNIVHKSVWLLLLSVNLIDSKKTYKDAKPGHSKTVVNLICLVSFMVVFIEVVLSV